MRIRIVQSITYHGKRGRGYLKFEKRFENMYGIDVTGKIKRKLKSIFHYIINNDHDTARQFYLQLQKLLDEKGYSEQ